MLYYVLGNVTVRHSLVRSGSYFTAFTLEECNDYTEQSAYLINIHVTGMFERHRLHSTRTTVM